MTRGTLFLITDEGLYYSIEFNGDMYPETCGNGAKVIENFVFEKVKNEKDFAALLDEINKTYRYNDEKLYGFISEEEAFPYNFSRYTKDGLRYDGAFNSDYLYILNATDDDKEINSDEGVINVPAEEGCVLYFGKLCEDIESNIPNHEFWKSCEIISDPTDSVHFTDEVWITYLQEEKGFTEAEAKEIVNGGFHQSHGIEGCYNNLEEFGQEMIEDIYLSRKKIEQLYKYIDFESFARDYIASSDGYYELESGRVLIYNP